MSEGHWCSEHETVFFKKGKMKGYAHPIGKTGVWHNEPEEGGDEIPESVIAEEKADNSNKNKSYALSYAKDVIVAGIASGQLEFTKVKTATTVLADSFLDWLNK